MVALRSAARDLVSEQDIRDIVKVHVERAKKGDQKATKFLFDYVLGGGGMKGATFVQNVFHGDPAAATKAAPGSNGKKDMMAARAAARMPLSQSGDA
jgi:hypothetical protein